MDYKEIVEKIKNYISTAEFLDIVGQEYYKIYEIAIKKIEDDFELMEKDEVPTVTEDNIKNISSSLSVLLDIYLNSPLTENLTCFAERFALLTYNWNNNTIKKEEIVRYSALVERVFKSHISSLELLEITKKLHDMIKKRLSNNTIPSVEISRHYLEGFDRK